MVEPITFAFLFLAGVLITLSPCILPVLPIMLGSGLMKDRLAPLKTGLGLAVGFAVLGVLLAGLTRAFGFSSEQSKVFFAILVGLSGLALVLKERLSGDFGFLQSIAAWFDRLATRLNGNQENPFLLGLLLGGIWSPCVGPILGAAIGLTSNPDHIVLAGLQMMTFGLGAAVPLVAVAYLFKGTARAHLPRIAQGGAIAKTILGYILIGVSIYILAGLDEKVSVWATAALPQGWIDLTTRY